MSTNLNGVKYPTMREQMMKLNPEVGSSIRDTKTAITYSVSQVIKPKGGNIAWLEAKDRRGNTIKIDPESLGTRYVIKD